MSENIVLKPNIQKRPLSFYKLIAFDMDSTLINIECIDEIAKLAGKGEQVAQITESAMRGEISSFRESLFARLELLKGVKIEQLEYIYENILKPNEGAKELIEAAKSAGLKILLVSGGFSFFAEKLRHRLGIDYIRSNVLEIKNNELTGKIVEQSWGDVVDGAMKKRTVLNLASLIGVNPAQIIAVGDGANDLEMMQACGLSVAYHAKPKVKALANVCINSGGLDSLLQIFEKE